MCVLVLIDTPEGALIDLPHLVVSWEDFDIIYCLQKFNNQFPSGNSCRQALPQKSTKQKRGP